MSGLGTTLVNPFNVISIVNGMWYLLKLFGGCGAGGIMWCLKQKLKCWIVSLSG